MGAYSSIWNPIFLTIPFRTRIPGPSVSVSGRNFTPACSSVRTAVEN